jgi:hypothetical protein
MNLLNTQPMDDNEAASAWSPAGDPDPRSAESSIERRRFWRARQSNGGLHAGAGESFESLEAELVLLREENARLKAVGHQRPELSRLLGRARTLPAPEARRDGVGDEATQMLVEGLVIREALVEICQEIERSMVVFEAKLDALREATAHRSPFEPDQVEANGVNSAVSELRLASATAEIESVNGDGPVNP